MVYQTHFVVQMINQAEAVELIKLANLPKNNNHKKLRDLEEEEESAYQTHLVAQMINQVEVVAMDQLVVAYVINLEE